MTVMTFDIWARNFRSFTDLSLAAMGVDSVTLNTWKAFEADYQKQGHWWNSPVEEMIATYFSKNPDKRPASYLTVGELKQLILSK